MIAIIEDVQLDWYAGPLEGNVHESAVSRIGAADFRAIVVGMGQKDGRRAGRNLQTGPELVFVLGLQIAGVTQDRKIGPATDVVHRVNSLVCSLLKICRGREDQMT